MKQIGNTNEGKVILECSREEMRAFNLLADSAKSKTFNVFVDYKNGGFDADLEKAFEAIAEWLEVKDRANALRNLADRIDAEIKVKS